MIIEAVNAATKQRDTTRADVAKELKGLSKSALYRLLAGQGNTTVPNLDELLEVLGLAVVPIEFVTNTPEVKRLGYKVPKNPKRFAKAS